MAAIQERILGGWSEIKCAKCRENYEADNKKPKCETDDKRRCAITLEPKVYLSLVETKILDEVWDFLATNEILSKDIEHRQIIYGIAAYYNSLKSKGVANYGNTAGRATDKNIRKRPGK